MHTHFENLNLALQLLLHLLHANLLPVKDLDSDFPPLHNKLRGTHKHDRGNATWDRSTRTMKKK